MATGNKGGCSCRHSWAANQSREKDPVYRGFTHLGHVFWPGFIRMILSYTSMCLCFLYFILAYMNKITKNNNTGSIQIRSRQMTLQRKNSFVNHP